MKCMTLKNGQSIQLIKEYTSKDYEKKFSVNLCADLAALIETKDLAIIHTTTFMKEFLEYSFQLSILPLPVFVDTNDKK